jgi:hypothetical protein
MRRLAALVPFMLLAVLANAANDPAVPAKADPCATKESRQFDFWIGDWNVVDPAGKVAGHNRIEAILGGCALAEHWDGAGGGHGTSYNAYDARTKTWQQFWVDKQGGVLHLEGTFDGERMVLRSPRADAHVDRITWTPNKDATVRQLWETSDDSGKTWTTTFDGRYERTR